MPQVPVYNQPTVSDRHIASGYQNANINGDMIGENIIRANYLLRRVGKDFRENVDKQLDQYNKTRIVELSNQLDAYNQSALYDTQNGYYTKTGKNAAGQSAIVMQNFDQYAAQLLEESGLQGQYQTLAMNTISAKRNSIYGPVSKHDYDETQKWQNSVCTEKQNNLINQGIFDRNDDKALLSNYKQGINAVMLQADLQGWDQETTNIKKQEFTSKYHGGVINALIVENNNKAKDYYNKYKNELTPDQQTTLIKAIHTQTIKDNSRNLADTLHSMYKNESDAFNALDKRKSKMSEDEYDATSQKLSTMYSHGRRLHDQDQTQKMNSFYDNAAKLLQNGQAVTDDLIPLGLDGKNYLTCKNALESLNKKGDIDTDKDTYTSLWYDAEYNAEKFKGINLDEYKLSLSKNDYEDLKKRQQAIQKGDYYTVMDNTAAIKKHIKAVSGIKQNEEKIFTEYQSMVRSLEEQKGRKATDIEKENILQYLGTNKDAYKLIERGMKNQADFSKRLSNNIAYYQARHNGDMPPSDMVYKWVKEDTVQYYNSKVQKAKETALNTVKAKPNEQRTLTYFADSVVPQMSKDLGVNLVVTSRYRNQKGSKHGEGRALDISLSEHNAATRKDVYTQLLKNPNVEALGCSDPAILSAFRSEVKKGRLVDERAYDKQNGTNHVNHVHVTLYKDGTFKPSNVNIVAVRNKLKTNGYTDAQINSYLSSKGLI